MDDYYEIVGVERTASREAIDRKIREQLRLWQRRTANADLTRRQEAERRVQELGQARTTLLDEEKRRRYDRQLTAFKSSEQPPAAPLPGAGVADPTVTGNWLAQARGYLAANDHQSAAYAARETLRTSPNPPPEVWTILARANTELGRLDDALFEAQRATSSAPDSVEAQLALAAVHEQRDEWSDAGAAYEAASRIDPGAEAPHLGMARALARSGRPGTAMERLERRFAESSDRTVAGRLLARGLAEAAEVVLAPPAGRSPAQSTELGLVQRMLSRARQVTSEPLTLRRLSAIEQQLARVRSGYGGSARSGSYRGSAGSPRYEALQRFDTAPATPPPPGRTNALAVVSLVLAIGGLVTCITAPLGALLGHLARSQIRERGEQGDGVALAAVVVGWLVTVVICCGGMAIYAANF